MLVQLPNVLSADQVKAFRSALEKAEWSDGKGSAGYLSRRVKENSQLPDTHPLAVELGKQVLEALHGNPLFTTAALPAKILPPLFNSYSADEHYGRHVDGAIRPVTGTPHRIRTDLSATIFLSDPESYDGGELQIEDTFGARRVKLPAGSMVLYPGTSVHRVTPVTRGRRLASFFWIQSMVREDHKRMMLFELDRSIQKVATENPESEAVTDLAGVYHNLLRLWAEV
jgi:PKHD-type hydroxylase